MTMVSENGMAWWSSTQSNGRRRLARRLASILLVAGAAGAALPAASSAQAVSPSEREALVRVRISQGGVAEEVDALLRHADEAASKGLPVTPLTNKIREGLAKGAAPDRIEAVIGDGADAGLPVRYVVEPEPRGTGGAVKFAAPHLDGPTFVFNGDVLTDVDLNAVLDRHRALGARATLVLAPVDDPLRYGLVDTDSGGRITRFIEKPDPSEVRCRTINAGIYILEPDTFDLIPTGVRHSIERGYFPALIERGENVAAYIEPPRLQASHRLHPARKVLFRTDECAAPNVRPWPADLIPRQCFVRYFASRRAIRPSIPWRAISERNDER